MAVRNYFSLGGTGIEIRLNQNDGPQEFAAIWKGNDYFFNSRGGKS